VDSVVKKCAPLLYERNFYCNESTDGSPSSSVQSYPPLCGRINTVQAVAKIRICIEFHFIGILALLSTWAGAQLLVTPLESRSSPLASPFKTQAQAIVVLGGGRKLHALEYDGKDIPSDATLHRLRYAAKLYRETHLPILVTGGSPDGSDGSEAAVMAQILKEDFAIPVKWLEENSNNTSENARFSAQILKNEKISRIILITDAIHMPRSQNIFSKMGLDVVAAPTMFSRKANLTAFDFFPSNGGLSSSSYALHEWIGLLWYAAIHGK